MPLVSIQIKAVFKQSNSVLMAESGAIALAARIASLLHFQGTIFLSDNQSLVTFLNSADCTNPPEWQIKIFTQSFINDTTGLHARFYKIDRTQNTIAHLLAQARSLLFHFKW